MTARRDDVDAIDVLARLAKGSLTAEDVVDERLGALHAVHITTGAVRAFDDEQARSTARALDDRQRDGAVVGALHGLPITVKDWVDVAGWPCAGTSGDRSRRPAKDATVVARLRAAGAVVLAKTAAWGSTWDEQVVHHLDSTRTPGGSSAGEGVAVGSGASWLGVASDSGGSIRLPAAWCGCLGLKPTAGLVPTTGHFPRVGDRSDGRTQIGLMANDERLLRMALTTIVGPDGLDGGVPPVPFPVGERRRPIRFAVLSSDDRWPCDDEIARGVEHACDRLDHAGLQREPWTGPTLSEARDVTQRYWDREELTGAEVARQLWDWDRFRRRWLQAFADLDVVVTPVTATSAPRHRELTGDDFAYTLPASLAGAPALAVPVGHDGDGLPIAVQLVGRHWHDDVLLDLVPLLRF